jgi:hypothetical protein
MNVSMATSKKATIIESGAIIETDSAAHMSVRRHRMGFDVAYLHD